MVVSFDPRTLILLLFKDSISARTRGTDAISIYSSEISLTDLLSRIQDENW